MNNANSGLSNEEPAAMLRALLNTAVDAIITIDQRGIVHHANPAVTKLFGYPTQDLIGKNISMLMPSPDRERHDQYVSNYCRTGHAKIIGIGREVMGRHADGREFPVDLAVSEVQINGQRLFTGIVRDMTDRRRTEEALRRERIFADNLLETANAAVLILNSEGKIARLNNFLERLVGFTTQEVRGLDWFERFVPEGNRHRAQELFEQIMADQSVPSEPISIVTSTGEERVLAWAGRRLTNADDVVHGMLLIGNDITELQQAEQKLIQQERLAAIGQMVTGLAHESRNALQRSRACLDMLELDCGEQPDQLDLIGRAQQALVELQRLYEEVRSYAAPINLEKSDCDLAVLSRETWERLDPVFHTGQVDMAVHCNRPGITCRCDRERIGQVLRNIFENSLAVAPKQSRVQVLLELVRYQRGQGLQVRVRDQGPGLSPEQRAKIFEPFYTTKTKGTGLGMPISRRIVESHGGEIWVGPNQNPGAEIGFILPLDREYSEQ